MLVGTEYIHESARLSLQSSELAPPAPSPAGEGSHPPGSRGGGTHSLAGEGEGGADLDEGTDTLVL
jgi:hypothetical protein